MDIDDIDVQVAAAMRSVAEAVRPPVEDLVRAGERRGQDLRRRHSRVTVGLSAGVGLLAAALIALLPSLGPGSGRQGPAPLPAGTATPSCASPVETGPLPSWATTGFSNPDAGGVPFVRGAGGRIVAILFGQPLSTPEAKDHANKILWVSRQESVPLKPLVIQARLGGSGLTVRREVAGGPGPSYLDLPGVGCWHLTLTWDGGTQHDQLDLGYRAPA